MGGPYTVIGNTGVAYYWDASVANGSTYYYVVSAVNATGESQNSAEVKVTALPPVSIQPSNQTVITGTAVTLKAVINGITPTKYQWYFNGSTIAGATSVTYTISSTTTANSGNYMLIVWYGPGYIQSPAATLTVVIRTKSMNTYQT